MLKIKKLKASMTIEAAFIIPLVLFLFIEVVLTLFFYYDKNILNGAAYETVIVGSNSRKEEELTEIQLVEFCEKRLKRKCIFFTSYKVIARRGEEKVQVDIFAKRGRFQVNISKSAVITEPEDRIRNIRRMYPDGA